MLRADESSRLQTFGAVRLRRLRFVRLRVRDEAYEVSCCLLGLGFPGLRVGCQDAGLF